MAAVHGTSTVDTYLMKKTAEGKYAKVVDIINFPDLGGDPEQIDITTLTDHMRRSIPGVQEVEPLTFESNYTQDNYALLTPLNGVETEYAIFYGRDAATKEPDGHDGKFGFTGTMTSYPMGGGVNEPRKIRSVIMPSTEIEPITT